MLLKIALLVVVLYVSVLPRTIFATFILKVYVIILSLVLAREKLCIIYFYLILYSSVILNVITMYINFILDVQLS